MTDTFTQPCRTARARRLLTTLLFTAALVAAVAAASNTGTEDGWWPRTGGAFTPPTGTQSTPVAPEQGTLGQGSAACGVGRDRASCTHPAPGSSVGAEGSAVAALVTPSVWKTALLLLPVAAGLTAVGRSRSRKATR
ncbi:hypothetical protein ACH4A8_37510 [Streptomyces vietnamensis]|uniref:hypothetical protein n=1 Tax=Streptomyces vietnamensis TaxID=362257 RepID=UPI0037B46FB5